MYDKSSMYKGGTDMIICTCIQKHYDKNNKIIGYTIKDNEGKVLNIYADALKEHIRNNVVNVTNLTLTSDNRLVDKGIQDTTEQQIITAENVLQKAAMLGSRVMEVFSVKPDFEFGYCKWDKDKSDTFFIIEKAHNNYIIAIPKDMKTPFSLGTLRDKNHKEVILRGNVTVVGGESLTSLERVFQNTHFNKVDISKMDCSNIENMVCTFQLADIGELDMRNSTIKNVTNMSSLFASATINKLKFDGIDTSKVRYMGSLFYNCKLSENLDLSILNTKSVSHMSSIFQYAVIPSINMNGLNGTNLFTITDMFNECNSNQIDLRNFNLINAKKIKGAFNKCNASILINYDYNRKLILESMGHIAANSRVKFIQ